MDEIKQETNNDHQLDCQTISDILKNNGIFIDKHQLKIAFNQHQYTKQQLISDLCETDDIKNDNDTLLSKMLSNDLHFMTYTEHNGKQKLYDILLHYYIKPTELNHTQFIKILTKKAQQIIPNVDIIQCLKIAKVNQLNGKIFDSNHSNFKNDVDFAQLFQTMDQFHEQQWIKLYNNIQKWEPEEHIQCIFINHLTEQKEEKYTTNEREEYATLNNTDDSFHVETDATDIEQSTRFYEIIPYKSDYKSSAVRRFYPFWEQQNLDEVTTNWKTETAKSIIAIISLFSTITQILFIIYASAPYKWISLTFLLIGQITCSALFCVILLNHYGVGTIENMITCCFGCCFIPVTPIAILILLKIYAHEPKPFIITTAPSLAVAAIQSYPQTILIAIMISVGDYNVHTNPSSIINCTFLASFLSVIALCIQIGSICKRRNEFVTISLWLVFDFVMTLIVALTISYDSITLIIFYTDIALYGIWLLLITLMLIMWISYVVNPWICACGILTILIVLPLIPFESNLIIIIMPIIVLLILLIVFTMYFYSFSFVWYVLLDYIYALNIFPWPMSHDHRKSNRYTLYKWVIDAENKQQQNERLFCINLVILDYDNSLRAKYNELCTQIMTNIRTFIRSIDSTGESLHQMTSRSLINRFYLLLYQMNNEWKKINVLYDLSSKTSIIKWLMIYFPINRMLHFIVPFVIILYIMCNNAPVDIIVHVLFILLLILLIVCFSVFCMNWKLWNYYRLILPIHYTENGMNMCWNDFATQIANCHYYITSIKIIADWCVNGGADKYIAYVIINFVGVNNNTAGGSFTNTYKMLLLGAGQVGKSTILKQVRHLHDRSFDQSELLAAKPHLTQNLIEAMRTIAIYSDILNDHGKDTGVSEACRDVRNRVARMSDKQKFTQEHFNDFSILWNESGIKNALKYRNTRPNTFQLNPNCEYLFENMCEYWKDEYIPTYNDLLNSYQRTTGVNKIKYGFEFNEEFDKYDQTFELFDTGGQKNERRKWMHFFPNTCAVIFVVNLGGFCEYLWEDNRNNRLREDIGLFRGIVNLDVFSNSKWYIILNKYDIMKKHMNDNCKLSEYFKDYEGNNNNEKAIIEFVKQTFKDQIRDTTFKTDGTKLKLQFFITNALNTQCIESVFDVIHDDILKHSPYVYWANN